MIRIKRAYAPPAPEDGYRVLVDRIWPRGIRKSELVIDQWLKEAAPSTGLRKWFGHSPERWEEFCRRYYQELEGRPQVIAELRRHAREGNLTLIYATRDDVHNNAEVLRQFLQGAPSCRVDPAAPWPALRPH